MEWIMSALAGCMLVTLVCLFTRLSDQRKLILQLREEQRAISGFLRQEQFELPDFMQSRSGPIITIEILNAVEVAGKSSWMGGLVARIAPETIRRMVVQRTADTMRNQMTEHGVEVQVLVHDPAENTE